MNNLTYLLKWVSKTLLFEYEQCIKSLCEISSAYREVIIETVIRMKKVTKRRMRDWIRDKIVAFNGRMSALDLKSFHEKIWVQV